MNREIRILIWQFAIATAALAVWEFVARLSPFCRFLVASPSAVALALWDLVVHQSLWVHFVVTGAEALLGLAIGNLIGSSSGLLLWYSDTAARIARPFILALGSLPIIAFAPLMIVWFGVGFGMKVALATFSTLFVAFTQAYRGATLVANDYQDTLRGMNATRGQVFRKVIVPGSIEWVLASMRLNIGFGLLGAFIGEFIASDRGLGHLILRAGGLYNMPKALAAAVGITVLAIGLDALGRVIERKRYDLVQLISVPRVLWTRR